MRLSNRCFALAVLFLLAIGWKSSHASDTCDDVCPLYADLIMTPERNLVGSIRQIQSIANPVVGPRSIRGRWKQQDVRLGGEAFDVVFYTGKGLVQRIELTSTAGDSFCRARGPALAAINAIDAWQGEPAKLSSMDSAMYQQEIALWSLPSVDVLVLSKMSLEVCSTTVIFKSRTLKDASQL